MRIGVDLMGGDRPPEHLLDAITQCTLDHVSLVPICNQDTADRLARLGSYDCVVTEEFIEMGEPPLLAVRRKRSASMTMGVRLVKEKQIDALVSTGNTGALVATSMLQLPMLGTIERPALLVIMPNGEKGVVVLDVGANIAPKPEHLIDYAKMGVCYRQVIQGVPHPKVGLLNIGVEERKGTPEVQQTYQRLQEVFGDYFLGNIEGRVVFDGDIDVMVTDGFTGNVFLKTCEGVSSFFLEYIYTHFPEISVPIVKHFQERFSYARHPGGFLCGVDGIVVKCHGHSNTLALSNGIKGAAALVQAGVLSKFKSVF